MSEDTAIVVHEKPSMALGSLVVDGPEQVIERASTIATALAGIVKKQRLSSTIQGREYVRAEGWSTLGAMLGVLPREVSAVRLEDGGYEAVVELVRANDGAVIGRASAIVGMDESTWAKRPEYARRSMALTRATGKAFRLGFAWIMALAGFEPTPAEEMDGIIEAELLPPAPKASKPKAAPAAAPPADDEADFEALLADKADTPLSELVGRDFYLLGKFGHTVADCSHPKHFENAWRGMWPDARALKDIPVTLGEFVDALLARHDAAEQAALPEVEAEAA